MVWLRDTVFVVEMLISAPSDSVFSLAALESQLVSYVNDSAASETPFDVSGVPKVSRAQAQQESARELLQTSSLS